MYILGISCFYHDSAACLILDGDILAAAQEERYTRKKQDPKFPKNAIKYCLNEAGIAIQNLYYIVFYDKLFLTFERLLMSYLTVAPKGLRSWLEAMPLPFLDYHESIIRSDRKFFCLRKTDTHHQWHIR